MLALFLKRMQKYSHTIEPLIEANLTKRIQQYEQITNTLQNQPIYQGSYDLAGSLQYQQRNPGLQYKQVNLNPSNPQPKTQNSQLKISGVGIGTYKGSLNQSDDVLMFNGLIDSLENGINVIDTCRNFRGGRSQIIIGKVLKYLISKSVIKQNSKLTTPYHYSRNCFFIGSKIGYVRNNLPATVPNVDCINDHCVHPTFLDQELKASLKNLNIQTLDVCYLNNFAESQIDTLKKDKFLHKLALAFQFFEKAAQDNKIKYYGLSSWESFRVQPQNGHFLNLQEIVKIAERVGGKDNRFKFVQLPINIMMPEAFAQKHSKGSSLLEVAEQFKINIISNSPLLNGSLINIPLPSNLLQCTYNGAKHLQLIRSIPSPALVSTLIGQKTFRHVAKNMEVLTVRPLTESSWLKVFVPDEEPKDISEEIQNL